MTEALRVLAGFGSIGAASAAALHAAGVRIGVGELVAVLVVDASVAAMVAILLPLRHARTAPVVAALAGALGLAAFFGASLLLAGGPYARDALLALLALAPACAALISAGGAGYLARGVRRARVRRIA